MSNQKAFFIRHDQLEKGESRYDTVGLNTVKYEVKSIVKTAFYTKFILYYNQTAIMKEQDVN